MAGIRRNKAAPQTPKTPVLIDDLHRMVAGLPDTPWVDGTMLYYWADLQADFAALLLLLWTWMTKLLGEDGQLAASTRKRYIDPDEIREDLD